MSDLELRSQLYEFLGATTSDADGSVWEHGRLRALIGALVQVPVMRDLRMTAAPTGPDPRTDAAVER